MKIRTSQAQDKHTGIHTYNIDRQTESTDTNKMMHQVRCESLFSTLGFCGELTAAWLQ